MRRSLNPNALVAIGLGSLLAACATTTPPTVPPVATIDLPRFMGDWYVIAHIPSRPERNAYNAIETYALQADGTIQTTFRRNDGFDTVKTILPRASCAPAPTRPWNAFVADQGRIRYRAGRPAYT